jgi:hypothetical protein
MRTLYVVVKSCRLVFAGFEPAFVVDASDSEVAVWQLEARGRLPLGAPVVEGRAGDFEVGEYFDEGEVSLGSDPL